MLIEYRIRFDKDTLIITQRIDSDSSASKAKAGSPIEQGQLGSSIDDTGVLGGGPNEKEPGGAPFSSGSAPITFIGPIIFTCPPKTNSTVDPGVSNGDK